VAGSLLDAAWPAAEEHFVDNHLSSKPLIAPVITLPPSASSNPILRDLAAGEEPSERTAILYRLPLNLERAKSLPAIDYSIRQNKISQAVPFERPEGSLGSRILGSAIHAFLELLAQRLAAGIPVDSLLKEINSWQPRIAALLRNLSLSPSAVHEASPKVQQAISATLRDEEGLWLLKPRSEATSEKAITSWSEARTSIRVDRIFQAGEAPLSEGDSCLWIIDFKTTQYGGTAIDDFLLRERNQYIPQMSAYAKAIRETNENRQLRLGLYYPLLSKLIWWKDTDPPEIS
jgi:hypothetical protein